MENFPELRGTVEHRRCGRTVRYWTSPATTSAAALLDPHGVVFPPIAKKPDETASDDRARHAEKVLVDFPFADEDGIVDSRCLLRWLEC